MRTLIMLFAFIYTVGCGNTNLKDADTAGFEKQLAAIVSKADHLQFMIDNLYGIEDFSNCSGMFGDIDPTVLGICDVGHEMHQDMKITMQESLDTFNNRLTAESNEVQQDSARQDSWFKSQIVALTTIEHNILACNDSLENLEEELGQALAAVGGVFTTFGTFDAGDNNPVYDSCVAFVGDPAAGSLDEFFGIDGAVTWDRDGADNYIRGMKVLPSGKLILSESVTDSSSSKVYMNQAFSDGTLDTEFGVDGVAIGNFPNLTGDSYMGTSLATLADGRFYMDGAVANGDRYDHGIIRFLPDGTLDPTFANLGRLDFQYGTDQRPSSEMTIMSDNSLILTERTPVDSNDVFVVSKFDSFGVPDTTFGTNGSFTYALGDDYMNDDAQTLPRIQSTGKIIVVGDVLVNAQNDISVSRINPDGTMDTSFGTNGTTILDFGNNLNDTVAGVMILPNDDILMWGTTETATDGNDIVVVRLTFDGIRDETFDGDGVFQYGYSQVGTKDDRAMDLVFQPDGKMILIGASNDGSVDRWLVLRFNVNLTPDTYFGTNGGVLISQGGPAGEWAYQGMITSDNHLLVGGAVNIAPGLMDARIMKLNLGYEMVPCP